MVGDGILLRADGKYEVFVMIQDGTENCGVYNTEQEARAEWVEAQWGLNHNRFEPSKVKLFQFRPVSPDSLLCISERLVEVTTGEPNGAKLIPQKGVGVMHYEFYQDRKKEWRWRILARNGKIIADSGESYKRHAACKKSLDSMLAHAVTGSIIEKTERKKK